MAFIIQVDLNNVVIGEIDVETPPNPLPNSYFAVTAPAPGESYVGKQYSPETQTFGPRRFLTAKSFKERFSYGKLTDIMGHSSGAAKLASVELLQHQEPLINLDSPRLIEHLDGLVAVNLLTQQEKLTLLLDPTDQEP